VDKVIGAGWVTLRIWQPEDRGALAQIRDRSRREFGDWLPGAIRDLADIPAFLNHVAAAYRDGTAFFYAIVEHGEPVGQCSLHHRDEGMAELGYWIRTDRTGRGLAPAAVAAVTPAAFDSGVVKLVIRRGQ
jgi:ribosomal-protein-alanine N-acetyltransferase